MEILLSMKGNDLVVKDDYIYCKDKTNKNGTTAFRCNTCTARGVLSANRENFDVTQLHDHPPDPSKIAIHRKRQELKKLVTEQPTTSMKRLYTDVFKDVEDDDNIVNVPPLKSIRTSLYNARAKRLPKLPTCAADIELVDEWRKTNGGTDFLLLDDAGDDARILAFGTSGNVRLLSQSKTYYMDGTFKTTPKQFYQLFIIHVFKFDTMIPVIYALLPNKTEATYERFFNLLKRKCDQLSMPLQPDIIQCDFEAAVINSATNCFNVVRIRGCYFHYSQCIWRSVQRLGLSNRYSNDEMVGKVIRRAFGLPFLPLNEVENVWLEVIAFVPQDDNLVISFLDYVTETFVDELIALFPREIWTQNDTIEAEGRSIRTNNHLESFHGKMNTMFGKHPNIYRFIELLKDEQEAQEMNVRLLRAGTVTNRVQDKKYKAASDKLKRLANLLRTGDITPYEFAGKCASVTIGQKK